MQRSNSLLDLRTYKKVEPRYSRIAAGTVTGHVRTVFAVSAQTRRRGKKPRGSRLGHM